MWVEKNAIICVHSHAVSPVHFLLHVLHSFVFLFYVFVFLFIMFI